MTQAEAGITRAEVSLGWKMKPVKAGLMNGTIKWRQLSGTMAIKHDASKFSIMYDSSYRLKEGMGIDDTQYEGKRVKHKLSTSTSIICVGILKHFCLPRARKVSRSWPPAGFMY